MSFELEEARVVFHRTSIWRDSHASRRCEFQWSRGGEAGEQNIRNKTLIRHCDGGNAKSRAAAGKRTPAAKQARDL